MNSQTTHHRPLSRHSRYFLTVGNIGKVADDLSSREALNTFDDYICQSKSGKGRAAGESVLLFAEGDDGDPVAEYTGTIAQSEP